MRTLYVIATGRGKDRRYLATLTERDAPGYVPIPGTACGLVAGRQRAAVGRYAETKAVVQYWSDTIGRPCAVARL
jgi:hypothetical protein